MFRTSASRWLVAAAIASVAWTAPASAQSYTGGIGGTGFSTNLCCSTATQAGYAFHNGDFIQQTFAGTGLSSANALGLTLEVQNYGLQQGNVFAAFVNGTDVGQFTIPAGNQNASYTFNFNFAPVAATGTSDFTVNLTEQGDIPGGDGSTAFVFAGSSATLTQSMTTTPEPSSLALLGSGLIGLVPVLKRRRN